MKKLTLPKHILSAVLAVILTAGLGTAALASSEPVRSDDAAAAPAAVSGQLPPARFGGAPGASQEPSDTDAPAENAEQPPEKPEDNAAPSGEPTAPSGEPHASQGPNAADNEEQPPEKPEGDAA